MGIGEGGHLGRHGLRQAIASDAGGCRHARSMPGRAARHWVIPRRGTGRSVDATDESADVAGRRSGLGVEISDEDAIATLSGIWKKTLYGF